MNGNQRETGIVAQAPEPLCSENRLQTCFKGLRYNSEPFGGFETPVLDFKRFFTYAGKIEDILICMSPVLSELE